MTTGVPERLETVYLPVADLQPYYRNAHRGNVPRIRHSLQEHGQFKPVVVNRGTHTGRAWEVLCGSHTLLAAVEDQRVELAAVVVDVDDDRAAKINLVDNPRYHHPEDLDYDDRLLLELLADLPDLDGSGYDPGDVDNLQALLDHGQWDEPRKKDSSGEGEIQDEAMWPKIDMRVPPGVYDAWRVLLDRYTGKDDVAKLRELLRSQELLA
jgi:ParB-like nuclease domain